MNFKPKNRMLGNIKVICKIHFFSEYRFQLFCPLLPPFGIGEFAQSSLLLGFGIPKYAFTPHASNFGKLANCRI